MSSIIVDTFYGIVSKTPLQPAIKLSQLTGNDIYLKREDLQQVHSFKIRGAYNKIAQLTSEELSRGVITASAGNHAQGVALSAQKLGSTAIIVMPVTTPDIKVEAVRKYGGDVVLYGDSFSDAYEHCQQIAERTGRVFVHPFDDPLVIAGQGTIGSEILEQLPDVDYIFVPVGGGGLAAGVAELVKQANTDIKIIGVEPDESNAMQQSLKANERLALSYVSTFADGVAVKQVGEHTFQAVRKFVDEVITVSTDELCAAMKYIYEDTRSIVEPSGALSIAGSIKHLAEQNITGKTIATVSSGANIPFEKLRFVAERTVAGSGKEVLLAIELPEKPGALLSLCEDVINGHAITEFNYRLNDRSKAHIFVGIMVPDNQDKIALYESLDQHKYSYTDLSDDEIAKVHVRRMIGGPSPKAKNEHLYEVIFPERPGALRDFLKTVGTECNISLFNYRGIGGDNGRVCIGFETVKVKRLETMIGQSHYEFHHLHSEAADLFLGVMK